MLSGVVPIDSTMSSGSHDSSVVLQAGGRSMDRWVADFEALSAGYAHVGSRMTTRFVEEGSLTRFGVERVLYFCIWAVQRLGSVAIVAKLTCLGWPVWRC